MDFEDNSLDGFLNEHFPDKYKGAETLFHYTTLDGLDKITDPAADLYCTNFHALNDNQEFLIGYNFATQYLLHKNIISNYDHLELNIAINQSDSQNLLTPWIMSFSTEPDSLYQWRMYTREANGGYAIGFDREHIEAAVTNLNTDPSHKDLKHTICLLPCIYLPEEENQAKSLLDFMFRDYRQKVFQHEPKNDLHRRSQNLRLILLFASIIKHDSFKSEKEFRLILQALDKSTLANCKFFGGKPRLPSMINLALSPIANAIKAITISPHGDTRLLGTTANVMKIARNINCTIKHSNSSYNGR